MLCAARCVLRATDDVHTSSAWNRFLRDAVPPILVAAVAAQPPTTCLPVLAFLPPMLRVDEPFWQPMVDATVQELRASGLPTLLSEGGELCALSKLLRRPTCVSQRLLSNDALKRATGMQFAAPLPGVHSPSSSRLTTGDDDDDDPYDESGALAAMNIPELGLAHLAACVRIFTTPPLLEPPSTAWLVELYGALLGLCARTEGGMQSAATIVRSLRILPLRCPTGALLLVPCEAGPIYTGLPPALQSRGDAWRERTLPNLRVLSEQMQAALETAETRAPTRLLEALGVRVATAAELVDHILAEHAAAFAAGGEELGRSPSWRKLHERLRAQLRFLREHAELLPAETPLVLVPALAPGVGEPDEEWYQIQEIYATDDADEESKREGREWSPGVAAACDVCLTRAMGGLLRARPGSLMRKQWRYCYDGVGLDDHVAEAMRDEHFLTEQLGAKRLGLLPHVVGSKVQIMLALPCSSVDGNGDGIQLWDGFRGGQYEETPFNGLFELSSDDAERLGRWTQQFLVGLLAIVADPSLRDWAAREFRCPATNPHRIVLALPLRISSRRHRDGPSFEDLGGCFWKEPFQSFGDALPMVDLPLPLLQDQRIAVIDMLRQFSHRNKNEARCICVEVNMESIRLALDALQRDYIYYGYPTTAEDQLPLLAWLNVHLVGKADGQNDDAHSVYDLFRNFLQLFAPSTDGDPNARSREVLVADACFYEPGSAGAALADVLGIANLSAYYSSVQPLLDALGVRRSVKPSELCVALDSLSDALMDGALPFDNPERAFATSALVSGSTERLHAACTYAYEQLSARPAHEQSALDAEFFDQRRIFIPGSGVGDSPEAIPDGEGPRFSTSEDVYWFSLSSDEEELARACGLHALAAHYPASLKPFFVQALNVPQRPQPSTSRLLEALHELRMRAPTPMTERVVSACQARLAERDLRGLDDDGGAGVSGEYSRTCQAHGPGCTHPACRAFSELFGGGSAAGGLAGGGNGGDERGAGVNMLHQLGAVGTDAAESMRQAQQALQQAIAMGRRHDSPELRSNPPSRMAGADAACQECDEALPCDGSDVDLRFLVLTSSNVPLYVDRSVALSRDASLNPELCHHAETFAQLLVFLANLIAPNLPHVLHIFYEPPLTPTGRKRRELIGFNQRGALFFSLRTFVSLHVSLPSIWLPEVTVFWMRNMTHELAHNLAKGHDRRHEFLMERLLERFLPSLVREHVQQALRDTHPHSTQHQPYQRAPSARTGPWSRGR